MHLLRECFEIENTPVVVDSHGDDASDGDDVYVVLNIIVIINYKILMTSWSINVFNV